MRSSPVLKRVHPTKEAGSASAVSAMRTANANVPAQPIASAPSGGDSSCEMKKRKCCSEKVVDQKKPKLNTSVFVCSADTRFKGTNDKRKKAKYHYKKD